MNQRRPVLASAAVALLAFGLTACVQSDRSANSAGSADCPWQPDESITTKARIGYQKIPNADLVVKDLGLLEACLPNATVNWYNFASGGDVVQAYGADSVDIGLMGSSPATIALSEPLDMSISVVWIHDVIGSAESLVVRDESVDDIQGLRGSTIAVPFSSTAHFSLLQALQDAGLDPNSDVKLVNLAPEKMPSAWQGGQIDAAWVWDPVLSELTDTGRVIRTSADTAAAGKPTYDLGTASNQFIEKNPGFMAMWARVQDYAVNLIAEDPDEAAVSIAAEVGVAPDEAAELFAGYEYLPAAQQADPDHLGGKIAADLMATARFLVAQGGIDEASAKSAYESGVDSTPAAEVEGARS